MNVVVTNRTVRHVLLTVLIAGSAGSIVAAGEELTVVGVEPTVFICGERDIREKRIDRWVIMEFSYGQGNYIEGEKRLQGQIILGEHKLYLRNVDGDLAQSYVPLEKIERIRKTKSGVEIHVRPSTYFRYMALLNGEKKLLSNLILDIVKRRGLKKQFLRNEWVESEY